MDEEQSLEVLKEKIHRERGFNTHFYKEKCLRRRIAVRMRARGMESFEGYAELLDRDPVEYEMLLDALTINVSKFFRNREIWDSIERLVVPALFEGEPRERHIWSAGCASGEEAYSVSIMLREWASRNGREAELDGFHILGTDIDRRSLTAALRAEYPELAMTDTPAEIQERWFSPGPTFRLDPRARGNAEFAQVDLISGETPEGLSLILCRNVIIYFEREIQEALFQRFYDALVPGGFLVLGKVETLLGRPRSLFKPVSPRDRIFRKPE
jgi:chemotaxis protein methyltransferase CheR